MVIVKLNLLVIFAVLFVACRDKKETALPDMRLTLASNDARPRGAKAFRSLTELAFSAFTIETNAKPFDSWHRVFVRDYYQDAPAAYILLSPVVNIQKNEAEELKKFIQRGNLVLLITNSLSRDFEEEFGFGISSNFDQLPGPGYRLTDTYKFLKDTASKDYRGYGYYFYPFGARLDSIAGHVHSVASLNAGKNIDGEVIEIGSGRLILITNAEAFSNYFLLTGNNYQYAMEILSQINVDLSNIFWDEFYRRNMSRPPEDGSIFDAILSNPALRWAFWLLVFLCGIAIFTNLFRRQRVIPLRARNKNTTVEFTQTIAGLYYSKKDNLNIAQKMVRYFLEHIRSVYYIPHQQLDDGFAAVLAGKTNQPLAKTQRLVQRMAAIMSGAEVSDDLLLELNRQLTELAMPQVVDG